MCTVWITNDVRSHWRSQRYCTVGIATFMTWLINALINAENG